MVSIAGALGDLAAKIAGGAKGTPDDTLKLMVNGQTFEGWTSVSVRRSIKAISGVFQLTLMDKWAEEKKPWLVVPGDECKLTIGSEQIISGYIDDVEPSFDENSRGISISGRDKTADMVDCSAQPGIWTNIALLSLAKKLAAPFGVKVSVDPSAAKTLTIPFAAVRLQHGETAFETLDRQAKLVGALLTSDGEGGILITLPGDDRTDTQLVQGENLLSCKARYSQKERYSIYTVKSQDGGFDGVAEPGVSFGCKGVATDPIITRYRPLIIMAEGAATVSVCKQRAKWEVGVRIGKSTQVTAKVQGWYQGSGDLWAPNALVKLISPWVGLNIELLIVEVNYQKSNEGTTTELVLEPAAAYKPDPTLLARKEPFRQLVVQESVRK